MSLRIIAFQSENFKKLKAVSFSADPNVNEITGGNEEGKSSLLDAIEMVFQSKDVLKRTPEPIRKGEERAYAIAECGEPVYDDQGNEIDCKPTLKATRTLTAKGEYLKVENMDGAVFKSPQDVLNKITGKLSFDPLAFSTLEDKKQLETLLGLVKIDLDLEQWAEERQGVYDGRTLINRDIATLEGQVKGVVVEEDVPDEETSTASVLAEQQEAQKVIDENRRKKRETIDAENSLNSIHTNVDRLRGRIRELEKELESTHEQLSECLSRETGLTNVFAELQKECDALVDPDLSTFQDRLAQVEETNRKVRAKKQAATVRDQLQAKRAESIAASEKLVALDHRRTEALAAATMPVPELSFDDNGVTYRSIPFRQCSSEERLRVSVAMGMALNPRLRLMFIRDGSLLDTKHLEVIKQMAKDNQYQLWIERVDDSGKVGLYIEDGEIVNQPAKTKASKKAVAV